MDFLRKELVDSFFFTDYNRNREYSKKVVINGRTYVKFGTHTATTIVANVYKVYDPSVESYKYVALFGISRQHPCDVKVTKEEGIELANIAADTNPFMTCQFDEAPSYHTFKYMADIYICSMKKQLIKTKEEIIANGDEEKLLFKQYRR